MRDQGDRHLVRWRYIVGHGYKIAEEQVWTILWDNGVPMEIPPVGDSDVIYAEDVNNPGVICGSTYHPNPDIDNRVAFRIIDGNLEVLPTPFKGGRIVALQINNSSEIVGYRTAGGFDWTGILWQGSQYVELPPSPGGVSTSSGALNNRGVYGGSVGFEIPGEEFGHWISSIWHGTGTPILLDEIDACERGSGVIDIADNGQAIGVCRSELPGTVPLIWNSGTPAHLDLLIDDPRIIVTWDPIAITNNGLIYTSGLVDTKEYGWEDMTMVLTPVGSAPPDLNRDCTIDIFDLFLLLQEWNRTDSFADIDNNGAVDVLDLFELLAGWG